VAEEVLKNLIAETHKPWTELLPFVEFNINNDTQAFTGYSPLYLNIGMHPRTPALSQLDILLYNEVPYLEERLRRQQETLLRARTLMQAAQGRQKAYADPKRRDHTLREGQMVMLSSKTNLVFKGKGLKKLYTKYIEPCEITAMIGENAAALKLPANYKSHNVFQVSFLKLYRGTVPTDLLNSNKEIKPDEDLVPQCGLEKILKSRVYT
jgi:hypothetical protein